MLKYNKQSNKNKVTESYNYIRKEERSYIKVTEKNNSNCKNFLY